MDEPKSIQHMFTDRSNPMLTHFSIYRPYVHTFHQSLTRYKNINVKLLRLARIRYLRGFGL